jgi:hypothetical protein
LSLENATFIQGFAPAVIRTEFQRTIGDSLKPSLPSGLGNTSPVVQVTATIAVAAASVLVVFVSILWYGIMRRERRQHADPAVRHKFRRSPRCLTVPSQGFGIRPKLGRFAKLHNLSNGLEGADVDISKEEYTEDLGQIHHKPAPPVAWSISDITLDSGSWLSGTSLTASRMERIEEEEESNGDGSEEENHKCWLAVERQCVLRALSAGTHSASTRTVAIEMIQISALEDDAEDLESGDLAGCRYMPEETCMAPERIDSAHLSHALSPVMLDRENLEISVDVTDSEEDDSIYSALRISYGDCKDASHEIQDGCFMQTLRPVGNDIAAAKSGKRENDMSPSPNGLDEDELLSRMTDRERKSQSSH